MHPNLISHNRITDHILHFYGEVILVAHVVVDFVRVIWDVSDLFNVRGDSPIESINELVMRFEDCRLREASFKVTFSCGSSCRTHASRSPPAVSGFSSTAFCLVQP